MAKNAACNGKIATNTIIGVSLTDVEMMKLGEKGSKRMGYSSFAHVFVLGIGPERWYFVSILRGERGYTLKEWLEVSVPSLRFVGFGNTSRGSESFPEPVSPFLTCHVILHRPK